MQHLNNNILLIEEDPDLLSVYSEALEKRGYQVEVSSYPGSDSAQKVKPDLIISDVIVNTLEEESRLLKRFQTLTRDGQAPILQLLSNKMLKQIKQHEGSYAESQLKIEYVEEYIGPEKLAIQAKKYLN